jgi:murein L,D-transpeptidase YafK
MEEQYESRRRRGYSVVSMATRLLLCAAILFMTSSPLVLADDATPADKVFVEKKARRLTLLSKGRELRVYKIALGRHPEGAKEKEGDGRTPEGNYVIDSRNRSSRYHLSLHLSYPNEKDLNHSRELGVAPGGDIMIHGMRNGLGWIGRFHTWVDWTKGCIAFTDREIEEIDKLVPNGAQVEIRP